MNPIDFVFSLLTTFVSLDGGKLAVMKEKAHLWFEKRRADPKTSKMVVQSEEWYVMLGLAFLKLFATRWIASYLTAPDQDDDDREEEIAELVQRLRDKPKKRTSLFDFEKMDL